MSDLEFRVQKFLKWEAHLLDEGRYEKWLALYDEDARYWVPTHPSLTDPKTSTAHFNDDHQMMQVRVERLGRDDAYTEQPPPRSCRIVNLVSVEPGDGEVLTVSKLLIYEYRLCRYHEDEQRLFGATVRHRLRVGGRQLPHPLQKGRSGEQRGGPDRGLQAVLASGQSLPKPLSWRRF